jgi:hypothetical protein
MHKSWPFWLVSDQISTCWLAKSKIQHKTQQHKTHNNQHEMPLPYPPEALPSPSMGRLVAPPTHGTEATKVPKQGIWCQVCTQRGWLPCSGRRTETHQKSERWEGSWPYGQNFTQQPTGNQCIAVGGMLERGRAGVGACGEKLSHCLGDNWDNKKII